MYNAVTKLTLAPCYLCADGAQSRHVPARSLANSLLLSCRYKFNSAHIFDSAAAYFGSDNVGLCGIAWYFKVRVSPQSSRP